MVTALTQKPILSPIPDRNPAKIYRTENHGRTPRDTVVLSTDIFHLKQLT